MSIVLLRYCCYAQFFFVRPLAHSLALSLFYFSFRNFFFFFFIVVALLLFMCLLRLWIHSFFHTGMELMKQSLFGGVSNTSYIRMCMCVSVCVLCAFMYCCIPCRLWLSNPQTNYYVTHQSEHETAVTHQLYGHCTIQANFLIVVFYLFGFSLSLALHLHKQMNNSVIRVAWKTDRLLLHFNFTNSTFIPFVSFQVWLSSFMRFI